MRTLTLSEENEVSGGFLQFVLGVIAGMTANYAYEKAGGAAGIEKAAASLLSDDKCHVCDKPY